MKRILIAIAGAAVVAFAADPWTAKRASDWTEKETKRILTNSPWAIKATLESDVPSAGDTRGGMGGPGGGMGGPGSGMGGPGGGMGGPGGGMGSPVGESALQAAWNCLRSLFDGKALNLFAKHRAEQRARRETSFRNG